MTAPTLRRWTTPKEPDLKLRRIASAAGLSAALLPNGCIYALEHRRSAGAIQINQILSPTVEGGVARLLLRVGGAAPGIVQAIGPGARARLALEADRAVWDGETRGLRHRAQLELQPDGAAWLWRLEVTNGGTAPVALDAVLIQDLGLGDRGFLMNNEAYASQYIDHHIAGHAAYGPVVLSRQNLAQQGGHPWVAHGCLDGAAGFATDGRQLFGPAYRDADEIAFPFGRDLPGERLQHELGLAAIQSRPVVLAPGARAEWRFFGLYEPDHPAASDDSDLARIDALPWAEPGPAAAAVEPERSLLQDAPVLLAEPLDAAGLDRRYPDRRHEERLDGQLLSFFTPDPPLNRHVVLGAKERIVTRRHGALVRSGQSLLPDEATLCATCWMHGVFAAQLTIGNTSFHKLFSVSRDPYNVTRASGLRILVDLGRGWQLLSVPSLFEMGLSDCRWLYLVGGREIAVHAIASAEDPAMQWRVTVAGEPCRFLVFGHLVLGEREHEQAGRVELDAAARRFAFRPDPGWLWGQRYPDSVYHLVVSTPDAVDAIGGDELLYPDGKPRAGDYIAFRTLPTRALGFAVTGSLVDAEAAERLAAKYARPIEPTSLLAPAAAFWAGVTRGLRLDGGAEAAALDTVFPWLAHDAIIHLTVPHGLEQYTGAAWGTRDVCQGPVEFLLALEHDAPVREILRIVFEQQYESRGDWPQWFMLEPYSAIQDRTSHGDVIIWPLKALCDYIEATGDAGVLDEPLAWRDEATLERTAHRATVSAHVDKLLEAICGRFIPGTHLIRYGEGDWNDLLQPVDPAMRDWMVSSWTVALLFQQIERYAAVLRRLDRIEPAELLERLATRVRGDFERHLIRDGTVAGYALFAPGGGPPDLLIHPADTRTGLRYSLLPMIQGIVAGLFTPDQARDHRQLIRQHLLCPDGVRLLDRPVAYQGGPERVFRRAESSSFFGREIGLMYTHSHLRYGEAMAVLGEADAVWDALLIVNPIAVTERLASALPRQRNCYFSSSDAAFRDRYQASAEWARATSGTVPAEGGWRIYSSGPGLYANLLIRCAMGVRRSWGKRVVNPLLPVSRLRTAWNAILR